MRNGRCPRCGKGDIRVQAGFGRRWGPRNILNVGFWGVAKVDNYVCLACGYLESYVRAEDLGPIARSWEAVEPTESVG